MLKKFEVKNFKGFKDKLVFDLSKTHDYVFNKEFIVNGIANKTIVYGKNGSGKSNLGFAIFDIAWHLTEKKKINTIFAYANGDNPKLDPVCFKYFFKFGKDEVIYEYEKTTPFNLLKEKLLINGQMVISYNHTNPRERVVVLPGTETLKINLDRDDQSIVRYVYRNAVLGEQSPISAMMEFVDNMLWFRSLNGNDFSGYKREPEKLVDMIGTDEKLQKFVEFLKENDLPYKLGFAENFLTNSKEIMAKFKHNAYPLNVISSNGTDALMLFYCWSLEFSKISFLFLDEFDAYYHYQTSEYVLKFINSYSNFQSIVTTHNTSLMNNELTRPDCCFLLSNNQIESLSESTDKEIREAHNLEKMYRNGIFEE